MPPSTSTQRKSTTRKQHHDPCRWAAKACKLQSIGDLWQLSIRNPAHNHGPTGPEAHPAHRKRTTAQVEAIKTLTNSAHIGNRDIASVLHAQFPGSHLTTEDVKNERKAIRKTELGGYTATQALVGLLEREGVTHFVRYRDNRVTGLLITYPWCLAMWKLFPGVLMIDDTYKTNRFKMPLFNVTGASNIGSIFNAAFGLLDGEDETEFTWVVEKLEEMRERHNIQQPSVVVTDADRALKNALGNIWPDAQQQLCLWHICQHVASEAKKRWKGARGDSSADATESDSQSVASRDQQPLEAIPTPPELPHTPQGLTMLWKCAVQAPTEEEFEEAWLQIL